MVRFSNLGTPQGVSLFATNYGNKPMLDDKLIDLARKKAGKGPEWSPYHIKLVPYPPKPLDGMQVTGANHRTITRGPRKGQKTWTREGQVTVFITLAEWQASETQV